MSAPTSTLTRESTADLLLQAAGGGEQLAWAELISRYGGLVRAVVISFRLPAADAEDAVQSTWLRLLERMDTIKDPESLGSWLATTASRECLALIRRGQRVTPDDAAVEQLVAVEPGPETAVVAGEAHRAVTAAVGELTGQHWLLIHVLFYHPDCSYTDVSRATGMPLGSIGPTRGRLLRELRGVLERRGFGPHSGAA
jgi:RNA polymerase sigma factor (sigma-70 family)